MKMDDKRKAAESERKKEAERKHQGFRRTSYRRTLRASTKKEFEGVRVLCAWILLEESRLGLLKLASATTRYVLFNVTIRFIRIT